MADHNTILKQAARAVLKPEGLFQKGSSRLWIDDNGWFFTVVEFQSSWCDRGSYLNVGPLYLWNETPMLYPQDDINRPAREPGWADYKGDDAAFAKEIDSMARQALERVRAYRALADPKAYAAIRPDSPRCFLPGINWNWFMLAALARDIPRCRALYEEFLQYAPSCHPSTTEYFQEELGRLVPLLDDPSQLHDCLVARIAERRAFWRTKPGLKRLAVHPVYQ